MISQKNTSYSVEEAAKILGVSARTLNNWRYLGKGPKYLKMGGKIRYLERDVNSFIAASAVNPVERICG